MTKNNEQIWEDIYAKGLSNLRYPNELFVRLFNGYILNNKVEKVLDYGFGAGANLIHMVEAGVSTSGVEVSESAIKLVDEKLNEKKLQAELKKIENGKIPYPDNYFDVVVAWQVLVYNDMNSYFQALAEISRVLKKDGYFIGTMTATGDITHKMSERVGNYEYISKVSTQEGAKCIIIEKEDLQEFFPNQSINIGEYLFDINGNVSHHWTVTFKNEKE